MDSLTWERYGANPGGFLGIGSESDDALADKLSRGVWREQRGDAPIDEGWLRQAQQAAKSTFLPNEKNIARAYDAVLRTLYNMPRAASAASTVVTDVATKASDPGNMLLNIRHNQIQDMPNPYAEDLYNARGGIVTALTGKNELAQNRARYGLTSKLMGSGLWGSGVAEGQMGNLQYKQTGQDAALQQQIAAKRAEWGALGQEWQQNKIAQLAGIDAAKQGKTIDEQNSLLTQAGLTTGGKQFDQQARIKREQAKLAPYRGLAGMG